MQGFVEQGEVNMQPGEDVAKHLADVESTIRRCGWAVQIVTSIRFDETPFWAYTVGHEDQGRPELIIVGIPAETTSGLLNDICLEAMESGHWPEDGDILENLLLGGYEMRVIAVDEDVAQAGEWFNVALARRGDRKGFKALQIVWPDFDRTWLDPHNSRQPLLGAPWWLEQSDVA